MIRDFRTFDGDGEVRCDVCIAGAGAAGITLARALSGTGLEVILLESGGIEFEPETQELYRGANVGTSYFDLDLTRLRFLGGSTNHWGGQCVPLRPSDFRVRPWVRDSGWPLSFEDLRPYYEASHEILDLGPFVWAVDGVEPNPPGLLDLDPVNLEHHLFRYSAPATRLGEKYRSEIEAASTLELWLHANLVEIEIREPGAPAEGFRIRALAGKEARIRARCYVLALGGIENPRLLLASNAVMAPGIGNTHDLVGRYFTEHTALRLGRVAAAEIDWAASYDHISGDAANPRPWMAASESLQEREQILNIAVNVGGISYVRNRSEGYGALFTIREALSQGRLPDDLAGEIMKIITDLDGIVAGVREKLDATSYFGAIAEQAPNPDSRVMLGQEVDALGLRRVELDWRLSEIDRRTAVVMIEAIGREVGRLGAGRVQMEPWLEGDGLVWSDELAGNHHHMGTTRMATDPRRGVVDPDGQVFGCPNLHVAGSSVFPTGGFANPTLTVVALALRLADHLEGKLEV